MIILDIFRKNCECSHDKVSPDKETAYCPDCGELIENQWYMVRCACCGVKQKAILKNGEIVSSDNFCPNCGTKEFIVERIPKINFIDINYAVIVKAVVSNRINGFTQSWVEPNRTSYGRPKLLQQFR